MITFRFQEHNLRSSQVVEIIGNDGNLLGAIYPQEWGIRLVSKYLDGRPGQIEINVIAPQALEVRLP